MGKPPENSAGREKKWPAEEDRFHKPYVEAHAVDSSLSIAINERNWIPAGDDNVRTPPRTHALKGLFPED